MNNFSKSYNLNFLCKLFENSKMESGKKFTMCRLCLCENERFVNIFELNDWQDYIAAEAISVLLQFQVSKTDGYPHVVCLTCLAKLIDFMLFKECCQKSKFMYDEMFVLPGSLVEHEPKSDTVEGGCGLESREQDPLKVEASDRIIKQEELDIDCPSVGMTEDPFEGINTKASFAPVLLKHEVMQFNQENRSQVQREHVDSTTHIKYLQSSEQTAPNSTSIASVDADSCNNTISTYGESAYEKSKCTSISQGSEALSSEITEGSEGAFICSGERMNTANLSEWDVDVGKEKGKGEKDAEGEKEAERETRPEKRVREEIYKCCHCGKQLKTKFGLTRHIKVHGIGDSKTFKHNSALQTHLKFHAGSKLFKSAECNESFSQNANHACHVRKRAGSNQYKCPECGKCFHANYNLKCHMRMHTGSKPYKCAECGKCFGRNSNLHTHMKTHTGSKPYKCAECGKCFSVNCNLKAHMRVHTGSKPYKCAECDKCYSGYSDFKYHMHVHTGYKPYKCSECSKRFICNYSLKSHKRTHAGS